MKLQILKGSADVTLYVFVPDSASTTGAGKTGIAHNAAGLVASYVRPLGSRTAITLATQTVTGAHSDGGWVEVDATNMPGVYRLDLPDAVCASGVNSVVVFLHGASGMAPVVLEIMLTAVNPQDAVRAGLTALPNAAADAAGGLPISDAGGLDLDARLDAAVTSRASAAALATAQADLDTITGADGATLATAQALYAPAKAGDAMALTSGERTTLAAAIWNALTSGMSTVGSIGKKLADWVVGTIDTYTGNTKQTGDAFARLGAPAGASVSADIADLPTNAELATALAAADDAVLAAIAALNNLSQANVRTALGMASANLDTQLDALPTAAENAAAVVAETITELASVPGASPTLKQALALLYMALRNKVLSGASLRIHNDAGTVVATKVQTDSGTEYSEAKAT